MKAQDNMKKIIEYLSILTIVLLFAGGGIYYVFQIEMILIFLTFAIPIMFGIILAMSLFQSLREEKPPSSGMKRQWYQVNRIFGSIGIMAIVLFSIGLPIAVTFPTLYLFAIIPLFLFIAFLLSSFVLIGYFAIRKPSVLKEDFESAKYMVIPIIFILLFSGIARSEIGLDGAISAFVVTLIIVGIAHIWRKKL